MTVTPSGSKLVFFIPLTITMDLGICFPLCKSLFIFDAQTLSDLASYVPSDVLVCPSEMPVIFECFFAF